MATATKRPLAAIIGSAAMGILAVMLPQLEGSKLTSYRDVVGVWTNCAGNTNNVRPYSTLTKQQCEEIDAANAVDYAEAADKCVPFKTLRPGQRVAVVLFTINLGPGAFCKSEFARLLRQKDPRACDQLGVALDPQGRPKWTTAGGVYWPGLQNRRNAERHLCERQDIPDDIK